MLNHDRATKKAKTLWLKTKTEFTGNWHIDLDDQAIIVNAFAAELSKAYAEIARLRAELASVEQFAESWPCLCAENYPGATMYHGHDCQTAIAVEFVAQWRAAKVKP